MKLFGYSVVSSLCALVMGVLLVMWPEAAVIYLVITVGVLFLLPGLYGIFAYLASRRQAESGRAFPVVALGSALLGLWLIVMPDFFVGTLMYVLGALLVFGGVSQLMNFISIRKLTGTVPGIFYVLPVLLLLAGILILVNPFEAAKVPFIVLGVSSIVYGLTDLFRIIRYRQKKEAGITDVEVISIDQKYAIISLLAFLQGASPQSAFNDEANKIVQSTISSLGLTKEEAEKHIKASMKRNPDQEIDKIMHALKEMQNPDSITDLQRKCMRIAEISGQAEMIEVVKNIFEEIRSK